MDLRGTRDPRPLDHGQPDRTAADHRYPRAFPDLGGLEHGADAGRDRASDQAGLLSRQLGGERHDRRTVQHAPRCERTGAEDTEEVTSVTSVHPAMGDRRGPAEVRGAAGAPPALAAGRPPADHDTVSGGDVIDALACSFDDAGSLVPEQHRERMVVAGPHDVEIGVAHAGRLDPDADLAGTGLVEVDLLDAVPLELGQDDAAIHVSSRSVARTPPARASVRSVSAMRCRITVSTPACPPTASP